MQFPQSIGFGECDRKKIEKSFDKNVTFYTIALLLYEGTLCGCSSMARVPAFQADCCGFESHHPLQLYSKALSRDPRTSFWFSA